MSFVHDEKLLVRCVEKEYGRNNLSEILSKVSSGNIPFYASVLAPYSEKWIPLAKHQELSQRIVQSLKSTNHFEGQGILGNWFVHSSENSFGPFSLVQMIELYQQNNLHTESLIRHPQLKNWVPLSEVKPFDDRSIKSLFEYPGMREIFTRRKSPRVQYSNDVCVSIEGDLFSGVSLSLSTRGIGVLLDEKTNMRVKDKLNLLIDQNSEHGRVQSKCEVVSLNRFNGQDRLGLVFAQEIEALTEYVEKRVPLF